MFTMWTDAMTGSRAPSDGKAVVGAAKGAKYLMSSGRGSRRV